MYYMEVKVGHKRFTFLHNYTIIVAIKDLVIVCQSSYIGVPQHMGWSMELVDMYMYVSCMYHDRSCIIVVATSMSSPLV